MWLQVSILLFCSRLPLLRAALPHLCHFYAFLSFEAHLRNSPFQEAFSDRPLLQLVQVHPVWVPMTLGHILLYSTFYYKYLWRALGHPPACPLCLYSYKQCSQLIKRTDRLHKSQAMTLDILLPSLCFCVSSET